MQELLDYAEKALHPELTPDDFIERLGDYVNALEASLVQYVAQAKRDPEGAVLRQQLNRLTQLHDSLLERAEQLLGETSGELRRILIKTKGILTYTGNQHGQSSSRRSKRG